MDASAVSQVETARTERSDLEKASIEAAAKVKELDAQRATLIKTHAKDRQTWQTQLRAAQTAEKEARAEAAKATARAADLEAKQQSSAVGGRSAQNLRPASLVPPCQSKPQHPSRTSQAIGECIGSLRHVPCHAATPRQLMRSFVSDRVEAGCDCEQVGITGRAAELKQRRGGLGEGALWLPARCRQAAPKRRPMRSAAQRPWRRRGQGERQTPPRTSQQPREMRLRR